jgi:hypothetical protein
MRDVYLVMCVRIVHLCEYLCCATSVSVCVRVPMLASGTELQGI